jgi:hypothetical protein
MSNLFSRVISLQEAAGTKYDSGVGYTARVFKKGTTHVAKFFKNGEHMKDADYEHDDAHDFAKEEMEYRKSQAKRKTNESVDPKSHIEQTLADFDINSSVSDGEVKVHKDNKAKASRLIKKLGYSHKVVGGLNEESEEISERINKPQGHENTADKITDDSKDGRGHVKKMMGNRVPMEIVAKLLTGK